MLGPKKTDDELRDQLVLDYLSGKGFSYLQSEHKISYKRARRILISSDVKIRPQGNKDNLTGSSGHEAWNKGVRQSKTHCPQGHPYEGDNIAFTPDGYQYCKTCKIEQTTRWREDNLEKSRKQSRESAKRRLRALRSEAIVAYGGKCVCCGESIPEFLHLDHVNNDGAAHRRELAKGSSTKDRGSMVVLRWAKNNNWPETLQLKCHNCGMAEGFYGRCPHEDDRP